MKFSYSFILAGLVFGCNQVEEPHDRKLLPSKNYHYSDIQFSALVKEEKVYVPVYSDIYHQSGEQRFALTATLSIRNTSLSDTMYIAKADYHDSEGLLKRAYLTRTIFLPPLGSVEFVVENKEKEGGAGANFIVDWGANDSTMAPVIQAVMIGTTSQQGISFVTEGVVVEEKKVPD